MMRSPAVKVPATERIHRTIMEIVPTRVARNPMPRRYRYRKSGCSLFWGSLEVYLPIKRNKSLMGGQGINRK